MKKFVILTFTKIRDGAVACGSVARLRAAGSALKNQI
jgi:hypothetical protein